MDRQTPFQYDSTAGNHAVIKARDPEPSEHLGDYLTGLGLPKSLVEKLQLVGKPADMIYNMGRDSAENVGDIIQNGPGLWSGLQAASDLASVTPAGVAGGLAKAMFVGPRYVGRLEEAGRLLGQGKGSTAALKEAEAAWANQADPRKVWDDTGWAPGDEFGKRVDGGYQQPVSWHPLPDMDLASHQPGLQKGTVGDLYTGIDDLKAGAPEFAGLSAGIQHKPNLSDAGVWGRVEVPTGTSMTAMHTSGRSPEELRMLGYHEMQHGVHGIDDPRNVRNAFDFDALERPISNVPAIDKLDAARADASGRSQAAYEASLKHPSGSGPYIDMKKKMTDEMHNADAISDKRGQAPSKAAYANAPHERRARAAALNYSGSRDDALTSPYPGDIDTFADEAFWPAQLPQDFRQQGVTLRDLERPVAAPFQTVDPNALARFSKMLP